MPSENLLRAVKREHGARDDAEGCIEIWLGPQGKFPDLCVVNMVFSLEVVAGDVTTLARWRSLDWAGDAA
jgi:hypothetical protein